MLIKSILSNIFGGLMILCAVIAASAQTTEFTYQGKLTDSGTPQAIYQMQFKLFDAASTGSQIGATITNPSVAVSSGVFTVNLDFGAAAFDGADRFLEIAVKRSAGDSFTVLAPRQKITSAPYSIRTLSALQSDLSLDSNQLGGIPASGYVTTASVGNSFIRNDTTPQTGNFNINGNGIVGGNLGIGITPVAGIKLDVSGAALFRTGGSGGNMQFGNPNGETGISIVNTNRADIKFDNSTLRLVVGSGTTPPLNTNGISISNVGNVGINTTPDVNYKLFIDAGNKNAVFATSTTTSAIIGQSLATPGNGAGIVGFNFNGGDAGVFSGTVQFLTLSTAGSTQLCLNAAFRLATCSSSLRYKKDIEPFGAGLNFIDQLRPIVYKWKDDNKPDTGFGAEEVAKINPLFVTYNANGEVEGVKYDRLSVVFVNAFKEQQMQIERQQKQLEQQQIQIENLKKLICLDHPNAEICQAK
jgi:hypothetical protein